MSKFKLTCLGGCGHIGSNMFLFEDEENSFYIDCGISFPNMELLNVNYETPDPSFFPDCENLIVTHGHEDHIGAIPFLFPKKRLHIWCSTFVKHLLRNKLSECSNKFISLYKSEDQIDIGDFRISPFQVDHSIPETHGIHISHQKVPFEIVYISDFKIGTKSQPAWFEYLKKNFRKNSKKLFMLDSTNIRKLSAGNQLESEILDDIEINLKLFKKRIFLTLFSSNVDRLKSFFDAAKKANRKVLLHGRSVKSYYHAALEAGILEHDDDLIHTDHKKIMHDNLLIICTGSQGESRASMNRIARGEDKVFQLDPSTDLVLFSSMSIPGNEEKIQNLKNIISEQKIPILDNRNSNIHVSGHASREDLTMIYKEFEPDFIMPIHGESQFLMDHRHFADDLQLNSKTLDILTGDQYELSNNKIEKKRSFKDYEANLYNSSRYPMEEQTLSERKKLAREGVISIALDKRKKLSVSAKGVPLFEKNIEKFTATIQKIMNEKLSNDLKIEKIKRNIHQLCGQRPIIIIH